MIKLNKEIKLNNCKNISLKYGSVNKNDPKVIYVTGKMWICPTYDGDFEKMMEYFHLSFKKELSKVLKNSSVFDTKYILDFDVNQTNLVKNKKKYFSITFFVRQKSDNLIKLKNIKNIISYDFGYLFNELENNLIENDFEVSKTKCSNVVANT